MLNVCSYRTEDKHLDYLNVPRKQAIESKVHCWLQDLQNSQAREDARVEDLPHGAWISCDAFTMEERETHEAWERVFLNARKLKEPGSTSRA